VLLESCYDTLVHFLHLRLIAGRATAKEIYIAGSYIAKDSGTDGNIGSYWNVGIGRGMRINMFTANNFQDFYKL